MRVAVVAPSVLPSPPESYGGAERVVYDTARSLGELGVDYTLFAPEGSKAPGGRLVETIGAPGHWSGHEERLAFEVYGRELAASSTAFDVVVDFSHEGLLLGKTQLPIVKMFMGISTWSKAPPPVPGRLVYVTISEYHANLTACNQGVDSAVLNHGIDTEVYWPADGAKRNLYVALSMQALHKGQLAFVRALGRVDDLVVAGEDRFVPDASYVKGLKEECERRGVRYRGSVTHDEKVTMFQHAKAVVLPFLPPGEAWSLIATEAMACGTPVFTTDTGAMREIVVPGTGRLFRDVNALAAGLRDEGFTYAACREHAVRSFDRMLNARRLLGICKELVG